MLWPNLRYAALLLWWGSWGVWNRLIDWLFILLIIYLVWTREAGRRGRFSVRAGVHSPASQSLGWDDSSDAFLTWQHRKGRIDPKTGGSLPLCPQEMGEESFHVLSSLQPCAACRVINTLSSTEVTLRPPCPQRRQVRAPKVVAPQPPAPATWQGNHKAPSRRGGTQAD